MSEPADSTRNLHEAEIGSIVDRRYAVLREIARGGMGAVVEAEHVVTGARSALKVLSRAALDNLTAHARLAREARILGRLRHPGVVAVHDAGVCPMHGPYMALEMIEGRPLDGVLLSRRILPVPQTIAVVVALCDTLAYLHRHDILHRDVKPSNVMISSTPVGERVELIDFGISRVEGDGGEVASEKLTRMGELLGTVEYMAPEQLMGRATDPRADVYGVGGLLYECLSGQVPYSGPAVVVIANMLAGTPPPSLRDLRPEVPPALEAVVLRALAIDPEQRYAGCRELADACTAALGGAVPPIELLTLGSSDAGARQRRSDPAKADQAPSPPARRFERASYVTPVRLVLANGSTVDGRTEDISEGGVLVVTDAECEANQTVQLRLPLPGTGGVATVPAMTRWVRGTRGRRAIGLELVQPSAEVMAAIRRYVEIMKAEHGTRPKGS